MNRPVDLPRVRRALAELDRLVAEHPALCQGGEHWADHLNALEEALVGTPTNERMKAYRRRLREQGRRRVSVFLTPEADAVLLTLRSQHPGMTVNDIISDTLTGRLALPGNESPAETPSPKERQP